jgi:hypothetical protein
MTKLQSLLTLAAVLTATACDKNLPTAADAHEAITRVCVASTAIEAASYGKVDLDKVQKVCEDPALQAKLLLVVQKVTELEGAVEAVLPKPQPLPVPTSDAGAP